ncbi:MAG: cold shock domain-containing protein [Hyphomicrobium sp.]
MGNGNGMYGRQGGYGGATRAPAPSPPKFVEPEGPWETGTLKFYDDERKFGFIRSNDGFDVMLHWRALKRSGINAREMFDDMPLRFKSQPVSGKSPEATIVRFA